MGGLLKQNLVSHCDILVSDHRRREGERLVEKYILAMDVVEYLMYFGNVYIYFNYILATDLVQR